MQCIKKSNSVVLDSGIQSLLDSSNYYLITIETQPASTGVVALEPYDSRS